MTNETTKLREGIEIAGQKIYIKEGEENILSPLIYEILIRCFLDDSGNKKPILIIK